MTIGKGGRTRSALRKFLNSEAAGGFVLMGAAALAMLVANSPFAGLYHHVLHAPAGPVLARNLGPMTPHLWINDGLMTIFFLLVGLEIKREFVNGRLNSWKQRRLPFVAAAAGMAVPAAIYLAIAGGEEGLARGWGIPAATDIAFAIGVLLLLGRRAPTSLKLFLTTVAIVDDMGAVIIIALFYTSAINIAALALAAVVYLGLYYMGKYGVGRLTPYVLLAVALWYLVLLSGIHATIAGVLVATTIPFRSIRGAPETMDSPLHRLEHRIAPWVAFFIVPLFGFANAGVSLAGLGLGQLISPLPLAIAAGLFVGKQLGIFGAILLCAKTGFASRPTGATWLQTYAVAVMCGIGFTMSLFIGALAFPQRPELVEEAKLGVLAGSMLSATVGYVILRLAPRRRR